MREADAASEVGVEIKLLGPLEVLRGGRPVALGGAKPSALLAALALEPGRVLSVDRLVDDLWPEAAPETAAHAVEVYVSQLREALGPDAIGTRAPGYVLALDYGVLDMDRFARLVDEGRTAADAGDFGRGSNAAGRGAGALARPSARGLRLRAVRADRDRAARGAEPPGARSRASMPTSRSGGMSSSSRSSRPSLHAAAAARATLRAQLMARALPFGPPGRRARRVPRAARRGSLDRARDRAGAAAEGARGGDPPPGRAAYCRACRQRRPRCDSGGSSRCFLLTRRVVALRRGPTRRPWTQAVRGRLEASPASHRHGGTVEHAHRRRGDGPVRRARVRTRTTRCGRRTPRSTFGMRSAAARRSGMGIETGEVVVTPSDSRRRFVARRGSRHRSRAGTVRPATARSSSASVAGRLIDHAASLEPLPGSSQGKGRAGPRVPPARASR